MPGPTIHPSAQGTEFVFGAITFKARTWAEDTNVPHIDTSDCAQAEGELRRLQAAPLGDAIEIPLECWGLTAPDSGAADTFSCTKLGITGARAIVGKVSRKGEAGGLINWTCSFFLIATT